MEELELLQQMDAEAINNDPFPAMSLMDSRRYLLADGIEKTGTVRTESYAYFFARTHRLRNGKTRNKAVTRGIQVHALGDEVTRALAPHTVCVHYKDFTIRRGKDLAESPFFRKALAAYPYPFMPTLLATAVPGAPVERKAYDEIKSEFLGLVRGLLPLDGVYLAMHGAMYVEGMQDAEGDWISAVRQLVGADCLITASYDLHGNISRREFLGTVGAGAVACAPDLGAEDSAERTTVGRRKAERTNSAPIQSAWRFEAMSRIAWHCLPD